MLAAHIKHYKETFWTRGVFLSLRISATTPLISIPALTTNGYPQNLTYRLETKTNPNKEIKIWMGDRLKLNKNSGDIEKNKRWWLKNVGNKLSTWDSNFLRFYLQRMHGRSCYQSEHTWPLGLIPIHQENFYTLYPYLHY